MNDKEVVEEFKLNVDAAQERFASELKKLRTGRAHPSMVDDVKAEVYESSGNNE